MRLLREEIEKARKAELRRFRGWAEHHLTTEPSELAIGLAEVLVEIDAGLDPLRNLCKFIPRAASGPARHDQPHDDKEPTCA